MNFKFLLKRPNPCDHLGSILSNFVMNQFVSGKPNTPDCNKWSVQPQNIPNTPETVTDNMPVCFNTDLASRENSCVPEPFSLQIMIGRNLQFIIFTFGELQCPTKLCRNACR
ncbi:hypothetical protein ERO13_D06G054626v2 [Gossypium hirsutum]|nr:hypothetical protein ERO13_D06G054626v2 [Gossypium hirsutum]KAG4141090.1 hypothetical protein ERO13_D06G054626v2 [Gossypium hirsutum]